MSSQDDSHECIQGDKMPAKKFDESREEMESVLREETEGGN